MRILIAMLIGVLLASGSAAAPNIGSNAAA